MSSIEEMAHLELTNLFNQRANMEISLVKIIVDYICTEGEQTEMHSWNPNCGLVERYYTRFGLKEGTQEVFRIPEGTLYSTCEYLKGKRHGWRRYYCNEKLHEESYYEEDQLSGSYRAWYLEHDQLCRQGSYHQGKEVGEWKTWHPNGALRSVEIYENEALNYDKGRAWDLDGTIKSYMLFIFERMHSSNPIL